MLPLPEGKASQKYCTLGMGASGPCVGILVYITSPVQAQATGHQSGAGGTGQEGVLLSPI